MPIVAVEEPVVTVQVTLMRSDEDGFHWNLDIPWDEQLLEDIGMSPVVDEILDTSFPARLTITLSAGITPAEAEAGLVAAYTALWARYDDAFAE